MCMRLAGLTNTRPDYQLKISQLVQVTEERFLTVRSVLIRRPDKAAKYATCNRISPNIPKLDGN